MKIYDTNTMTIEERKRIIHTIAKALGWKHPLSSEAMKWKQGWTKPEDWWLSPKGVLCMERDIPDYPSDLNAAHEMEKALNEEQWLDYTEYLSINGTCPGWCGFNIAHATAALKADAFIKVLNLEY